jgi:hypothetical protein
VILLIFLAVYAVFTLLPLGYLDCPYHTPLSGAFWRLWKTVEENWPEGSPPATDLESSPSVTAPHFGSTTDDTMLKAMAHSAMNMRLERDQKALVWTVKSLSDDVEPKPFVEAIPDVLWGPFRRRHGYEGHILHLAHHPEAHIHNHIVTLLGSCESGSLSFERWRAPSDYLLQGPLGH